MLFRARRSGVEYREGIWLLARRNPSASLGAFTDRRAEISNQRFCNGTKG